MKGQWGFVRYLAQNPPSCRIRSRVKYYYIPLQATLDCTPCSVHCKQPSPIRVLEPLLHFASFVINRHNAKLAPSHPAWYWNSHLERIHSKLIVNVDVFWYRSDATWILNDWQIGFTTCTGFFVGLLCCELQLIDLLLLDFVVFHVLLKADLVPPLSLLTNQFNTFSYCKEPGKTYRLLRLVLCIVKNFSNRELWVL